MRVARVWRASVLAVTVLVAGQLAPLSLAHADPTLPYAEITSPTGGVVTGTVPVAVDGHTDSVNTPLDGIVSLTLLVDAVATGTPVDCTVQADTYNCTGTISWNAGAATPGVHSLVVEMDANVSGLVDSAPAIMVTVPSPPPPPAATIAQVMPGDVRGLVAFNATGTIDSSSTDTPGTLQLEVNGALVGAAFACTANPCMTSFSYDTTAHDNTVYHFRAVFVTADVAAGVHSSAITFTSDNPLPGVTINRPNSGDEEKGVVTVNATGTIPAGENDAPSSLQLYVVLNGTNTWVDTAACSAATSQCTQDLTWNATGRPAGNYTLHVYFFTQVHSGGTVGTDTVSVHVTSPLPVVTLTAPAAGATVSGVVPVTADGEVDASQVDTAGTMQLFADGAAVGGPVDCPGTTKSCPVSFSWDASALLGPHKLHLKFVTGNGVVVTTADETVNVVIVPPTATVTAPAAGASVSGVVAVAATGVTDSRQSDNPATLQLLIDGAAVGTPTACPAASHTCSLPYSWDTTGLTGAHTVQSKLVTVKGVTALSAVTTVAVVSPAPTAVITSPAAGSTVARGVTVTVSGTVDATQTDAPASMTLTVDGKPLGAAQACTPVPSAPRSCQVGFAWNTVGLTDKHILVATVTTLHGAVGTSVTTTVYVYGGTAVVLPKVHTLRAGRSVTITGRATYLINKAAVPSVPVKILLVFSNGKTRAFTVSTDANGFYKVTFVPTMNTVVEATVVPLAYNGTSHTFTRLSVIPQPTCKAVSKLARNKLGKGVCSLPGMPKGTKLKLQYELKGKWYTLGTGKAPGTKVPFSYRFALPATYHVRLVFAASHSFVATTGPSLKVVVT
ncbi:hypothetical protein acdb102_13530 [Acidothermaceae bacterium B102]|nr:hypothetical protein acdb102_13530 [Acidothermaceae bacterium B102]